MQTLQFLACAKGLRSGIRYEVALLSDGRNDWNVQENLTLHLTTVDTRDWYSTAISSAYEGFECKAWGEESPPQSRALLSGRTGQLLSLRGILNKSRA